VDDLERDVAVAAEAVAGDWRQSPVASRQSLAGRRRL
jgi:hypothetical protein